MVAINPLVVLGVLITLVFVLPLFFVMGSRRGDKIYNRKLRKWCGPEDWHLVSLTQSLDTPVKEGWSKSYFGRNGVRNDVKVVGDKLITYEIYYVTRNIASLKWKSLFGIGAEQEHRHVDVLEGIQLIPVTYGPLQKNEKRLYTEVPVPPKIISVTAL